jgi:ABC transporter
MGLIGANGSGKSTLLHLIAGLTRPTTATIAVHQDLSGLLTLGESFQPLLSGEENALTAAILAGLSRKEAVARLDEVVAFAELQEHMDKPLRTLSDGMRLRLAFAVAVHTDPEILLLDGSSPSATCASRKSAWAALSCCVSGASASCSPPITWRRCGASVIGWCGCPRGRSGTPTQPGGEVPACVVVRIALDDHLPRCQVTKASGGLKREASEDRGCASRRRAAT